MRVEVQNGDLVTVAYEYGVTLFNGQLVIFWPLVAFKTRF
jgi:hypothetical protein